MKKWIPILLSLALIITMLAACSNDKADQKADSTDASNTDSTDASAADEKSENMFLTPYTYLYLPDDYLDNVTCTVVNEDPYTLEFKTKESGVVLYSIIFDEEGEQYLGTMKTELGDIDIYADVPVLSDSQKDYQTLVDYQKELSSIVDYWKSECGLTQENK